MVDDVASYVVLSCVTSSVDALTCLVIFPDGNTVGVGVFVGVGVGIFVGVGVTRLVGVGVMIGASVGVGIAVGVGVPVICDSIAP